MELILQEKIKAADKNVAIVIGAYVNGYHVIKALGQGKIPTIAIDFKKSPGLYSKYVTQAIVADYAAQEDVLLETLLKVGAQLSKKGILYPTHDHHTKLFASNYEALSKYYYVPVNPGSLFNIISKEYQYQVCAKIGIPFPKSFFLRQIQDINQMLEASEEVLYPLIIKPFSRAKNSALGNSFRVKEIKNRQELVEFSALLREQISTGFLVSEVIPGEPDQIWAYTGYCDQNSEIIAGWTGRKLTQRPYYFGVFSTARYVKNATVEAQGIALLKAFKHIGVGEPEFKYDARDQKYKLMETNPRYMMWHGLALQGGMNLPLIQYYHLIGDQRNFTLLPRTQSETTAHIVFMNHEWMNILDHKPRLKFIRNAIRALFLPNKTWGIFDVKDVRPYLVFQREQLKAVFQKIRRLYDQKSR
jgi:predicted ATP-grasp superfamily ATP-dependent carboligase